MNCINKFSSGKGKKIACFNSQGLENDNRELNITFTYLELETWLPNKSRMINHKMVNEKKN